MQYAPLEKARHISKCLELAVLLEASANKPGNVNRTAGFKNTRYEHFLASAVAIAPSFEFAAERGIDVSDGRARLSNIGLGWIIKNGIATISAWQHGGNTLLGTAILLSPIAVAAGMTRAEGNNFDIQELRKDLRPVVESTTPRDAINVYEAIKTVNPSGLGSAPDLDINDPESKRRILEERISLYQTFEIASKYDAICSEWVNNYPLTFEVAYPFLVGQIRENHDLNMAIVHTFLRVLGAHQDTLIVRKADTEASLKVSSMARNVLKLGGLETAIGRKSLHEFDQELRKAGNVLNPGTTADIMAAALALAILKGYRP